MGPLWDRGRDARCHRPRPYVRQCALCSAFRANSQGSRVPANDGVGRSAREAAMSCAQGWTIRPSGATRSCSVGAASILAVAFVGVGLGGQVDSTSASGSATSVDSTESVPVGTEWAGAWIDVTAEAIGDTAEWTNKVELADINGDGSVDLLFANGGDYETAGTPVLSRVFVNGGDGTFAEATGSVL